MQQIIPKEQEFLIKLHGFVFTPSLYYGSQLDIYHPDFKTIFSSKKI